MHASHSPLQDPDSFGNLFNRTQLIIYRFIYGLHGGPPQEIEDLTSDTYSRAWKGRKQFAGNEHDALCWLFTIARHLVIDAHRKRKNKSDEILERLDDAYLERMFASSDLTPEDQVVKRDQFNHLWEVMQELPDERREMLILRYMLGWQVKEIAIFLRMEENTVSVYIRRSLEIIRRNW
jgi:RNA polymerase sigma-70 factor (ECF subfamily)